MSFTDFTEQELEEIFKNRFLDKEKEWIKMKNSFIDSGVEALLSEDINNITFHFVYNKITNLSDEEVYNHLLEDI